MITQLTNIQPMLSNLVTQLSALVDYIASNKLAQLIVGVQALVVCVVLMFTSRPRTMHSPWQKHKRGNLSMYPPGMQFDVVEKKWARMGTVPPFSREAPTN